MGDEEFIKSIMDTHSTSDELSQSGKAESEKESKSGKGGIEADYGSEEGEEEIDSQYAYEKEFKNEKGIFDKHENDSEVEEYLDGLEEDEMAKGDLKLPDDVDEDEDDYGSDDGKGLSDYGDDDAKLSFGDYGKEDDAEEEDNDERDEDEDEMEQVFAQAGENQEMDIVENLRR